MKEWIPFLQQLIWPVFIVLLLIVFKGKLEGLYKMATEGREIEIAGVFKIGQAIKETEIKQFATGDLSIEAMEGDEFAIEKGSWEMLNQLQEKLRNSELNSIDVMILRPDKYYFKNLLLRYVGTLGIKQLIFVDSSGHFDGWIESSIFSGQILANDQQEYKYEQLKEFLAGIHHETIQPNDNTGDVLEKMRKYKQEYMPVIDQKKYKYFVNKSDILTALVSTVLTQDKEVKEK
ncbi:CBS domain-containing protein [Sunxiuqinia indica]|uniref:CBS domain-containing protein n=1 Tax=Sunxiuqinia indica TaxID=2692584 RepID=UPI00135999FC|nr:CBS domain-containing protein [Sunxiuqinia indica]